MRTPFEEVSLGTKEEQSPYQEPQRHRSFEQFCTAQRSRESCAVSLRLPGPRAGRGGSFIALWGSNCREKGERYADSTTDGTTGSFIPHKQTLLHAHRVCA